ncbi:hypothetical protein LJC59_05155 [Desulfovibrio sp. OttesenSCG-928-A18]|nr:hypothetical protein [Desulfovibrio sp. OttesenSCG-928-A18]
MLNVKSRRKAPPKNCLGPDRPGVHPYGFQALDDIASGKAQYKDVVSQAHDRLQTEVTAFAKATGKVCEKCGKPMRRKVKAPGKDGKGGYDFWGCTGYPECKGVLNE